MYIDIHSHVYKNHPRGIKGIPDFCTPEELIFRYDELNIEKGVLLPIVSPEIYLPQSNEDILEIAAAYPDRFIPFCNIDPRAMENSPYARLEMLLEYYKERGCKGLGEVMPNLPLFDPKVQNLFRCAEIVGLPVIFDGSDQMTHDFGIYDDPGLPQLEHTLQRFPNLIIFGHGPVFWSEIARLETPGERGIIYGFDHRQIVKLPSGPMKEEGVVPKLMRKYPNLYGDLSDGTPLNALARDVNYGAAFLEEFQDRLFFGTDIVSVKMPVELPQFLEKLLSEKKISEQAFNKIARDNAKRLLGID